MQKHHSKYITKDVKKTPSPSVISPLYYSREVRSFATGFFAFCMIRRKKRQSTKKLPLEYCFCL